MNKKGSICFETARKCWRVQYSYHGKRLTKRFKSEKEAILYLENLNLQLMVKGSVELHTYTIGEWVNEYLDKYKASEVRPTVLNTYRATAKLLSPIKEVPLTQLTPKHIEELLESLTQSCYTKKKVYQLIKSSLTKAKILQLVDLNVADNITAPKQEKTDIQIYTKEELQAIRKAIQESKYYSGYFPLFLTAVQTGMRLGEILGLKIPSVKPNYIIVENNLQLGKGGLYDERPKTQTSYRKVPISRELADQLRTVIGLRKVGYVFSTKNNTPISPTNLNRVWSKIQDEAGIKHKRFHDLRHTLASTLIAGGCPIANVSRMLGHSNVAITLAIYTHAVVDVDSRLSDMASTILDN